MDSLKERTWGEIQNDETQYEALSRLIESASEIVGEYPVPVAGEGFKKNRRYRGECMQRLIKEMYRSYGKQCNKFPELRFQIFPDSNCILAVTDGKKKDYY